MSKADPWTSASKWLIGGVGAVVILVMVGTANFVGSAVWDKIVQQIATEAQAASAKEVQAKFKQLEESDEKTRQEIQNLRSTQQVLIKKTGDVEKAVNAQGVISNQILRILEQER